MPQETQPEISIEDVADMVRTLSGEFGKLYEVVVSSLSRPVPAVALADHLSTLLKAAETTDQRLASIEADIARLCDLAEQAEKFLHNPIGAYKAARLGKIKVPDGQ